MAPTVMVVGWLAKGGGKKMPAAARVPHSTAVVNEEKQGKERRKVEEEMRSLSV